MSRPGEVLRRAADLAKNKGPLGLLRQAAYFARQGLFVNVRCYLYECRLTGWNEADFAPRLAGLTVRTVRSNQEADELAAEIGMDFRRSFIAARRCLDGGAVALCILQGKQLAHIGWVGTGEKAMRVMRQPPYKVDFAAGEAFTSGVWTDPAYRGVGLSTYSYFKRLEMLSQEGKLVSRSAVGVDTVPIHKMMAKFGGRRYAEGRYLRVLAWKWWRERPLPEVSEGA
jgi:hypothetical protein